MTLGRASMLKPLHPSDLGDSKHHGDGLGLLQMVGELLEWRLGEMSRLPQVGRQETIAGSQGLESGLHEISLGARVPARAREHVCEVHHLLHREGPNDAAASRSRDEPHTDRAALAVYLHGQSVRLADAVTPVPPSERNELHLRSDDASADRSGDLLRALGPQADVAVLVADQHIADETVALTCRGHLLDRMDLHHLVLQVARLEEGIDDLVLLDGERMEVDILDRANLAVLDQSAQLGDRNPLLLLSLLALALPLLPLALALVLALALALITEASALAEAPLTHDRGRQSTRTNAA